MPAAVACGCPGPWEGARHIRSADDLAGVPEPAWPRWLELAGRAQVPVTVVPVAGPGGRQVLFRLQVTARSMLGAVALNSGGILIDHGWLRLLGGGGAQLPDLAAVNGLGPPSPATPPPSSLAVAYDVLGGRFAINGGGLPGQAGEVCYWGPDTLAWTSLGAGVRRVRRGGAHRWPSGLV